MDVRIDRTGHVKIDDVGDVRDVKPARRHVCRHEHVALLRALHEHRFDGEDHPGHQLNPVPVSEVLHEGRAVERRTDPMSAVLGGDVKVFICMRV